MKLFNAWIKRIFLIVGIGILLVLVMDLNNRMVHMIQLRGEMEAEQAKTVELSYRLEELTDEIDYTRSNDFVNEWARQENMMRMDGDIVVVLIPDGSYEANDVEQVGVTGPDLDNWEAWKLWLTFQE